MNSVPRVLIVEDSPDYSDLFSRILTSAGYEVDVVADPLAGLRKARAEAFDILLLDNNFATSVIPGLGVLAVLKNIPHLKILMLTASLDAKTKVEAKLLGADAFLTKPVDADMLLSVVAKLLNHPGRPLGSK